MGKLSCPVCKSDLQPGATLWHECCPECRYEHATLEVSINTSAAADAMDEGLRETGIKALRQANFKVIVDVLKTLVPRRDGALLDVGAAHGWFLETARGSFNVLGVEPDEAVFKATFARGLPIRCGYFPAALETNETFDVIVFNDVIEHIPDISTTLDVCHARLNPGGILFLNLPNSRGFFYCTARFLCRLGITKPFDRMWQKGFPSPHVHYLDPENLEQLLLYHGFTQEVAGYLPSIRLRGLYERLSYDSEMRAPKKLLMYALLVMLSPLMCLLPQDIMYGAFRKN